MSLMVAVVIVVVGALLVRALFGTKSEEAQIKEAKSRLYERCRKRQLREKIDFITKELGELGTFDFRTGREYDSDSNSGRNEGSPQAGSVLAPTGVSSRIVASQ